MPRTSPVLTMEEKAAKYDEMIDRKRRTSKAYYENNPDRFLDYYDNNKEKLNARACELNKEKRAAAKAARAALIEPPPPQL